MSDYENLRRRTRRIWAKRAALVGELNAEGAKLDKPPALDKVIAARLERAKIEALRQLYAEAAADVREFTARRERISRAPA